MTTPPAGPQTVPGPAGPAPVVLPGLYEDLAARLGLRRSWHQMPLLLRADIRVRWAAVRAGQTDPWLVGLTGWRHRAATGDRRTLRPPGHDDAPFTEWLAELAVHRAADHEHDQTVAGQYLTLAHHLITTHHGDQARTGPANTSNPPTPDPVPDRDDEDDDEPAGGDPVTATTAPGGRPPGDTPWPRPQPRSTPTTPRRPRPAGPSPDPSTRHRRRTHPMTTTTTIPTGTSDRQKDALLTPAEVAALFRVDPKTVTRWARAGRICCLRTLGGHRRYPAGQFTPHLTPTAQTPTAQTPAGQTQGPAAEQGPDGQEPRL